MKMFGDVIDILDDKEEEKKEQRGFGIALRALDDGRFRIGVVKLGSDGGEMEIGYLDDSDCAEMFSMIMQLVASEHVETRMPTEDEIKKYFGGEE